jgi:NAD(P)H-hydrate epimerase
MPRSFYTIGRIAMTALRLRPLARDEVRSIDARAAAEFAMPTTILMENAGRGAAALLRDRIALTTPQATRVLILCGPGNNGGDGGVVARHLELWGFTVQVVWFADPTKLPGDAAVQWDILARSGIGQTAWQEEQASAGPGQLDALLAGAEWVVDGLLGTGLTRPVEGTLKTVIEAINRAGKPVLSLDLPSGLDADHGIPLGVAVRASFTATFVAPKLGFVAPGAASYTGDVHVIEIGVPRRLIEPFQAFGADRRRR